MDYKKLSTPSSTITRDMNSISENVGNVYETSCASSSPSCNNIDFGDLASSVGVGVTWYSPLGPLSVNLALPIRKPDDAETQVFQFSMGQTF